MQQRRLAAQLMEESGSDHALATLMILSYGTDMEIRKESGLLEALTRLIHHGRGFPHPPSIILDGIASESVPGAPQTTSRAKKLKDEEQCCSRVYQDLLCASNDPKRRSAHHMQSAIRVIANFSFAAPNKAVLAAQSFLIGTLLELLSEDEFISQIADILSNVGSYVIITDLVAAEKAFEILLRHMSGDDWDVTAAVTKFFKKNSQIVRFLHPLPPLRE